MREWADVDGLWRILIERIFFGHARVSCPVETSDVDDPFVD